METNQSGAAACGSYPAPGCSTCRYSFTWKKERPVDFSGTMIPYNVMWECRRHSVTTDGFPTTRADWWCGDYESNTLHLPTEAQRKEVR